MDTLVLDIETKNTFAEVGGKGREFLAQLEPSVVCVYSYKTDNYTTYDEQQFGELKKRLSEPAVLIGFSSNKFDLPILAKLFKMDFTAYPRIDLSDEVELQTGRLVSLDALAKANLGYGKTHESLAAPVLYRAGKIAELKEYCENDVRLTKELFDLAKKQGFLLVPARNATYSVAGEPLKLEELPTKIKIHLDPQTLF